MNALELEKATYVRRSFTIKPWGYELLLVQTDDYAMKILSIMGGHGLSRQYHREKDEALVVISGSVVVTFAGGEGAEIRKSYGKHDAFHVPPGVIHEIEAHGGAGAILVECSTPQLEDVVRLSDRYGRAQAPRWWKPPWASNFLSLVRKKIKKGIDTEAEKA